jgi:RimJ/RimL family protein N-acetyltransferase
VHSDPRAVAHNPSDALATRAEAAELYARWNQHWRDAGFGYWVVRRHDDPRPLGFCGVKIWPMRDQRTLNLFYRLDPECWGDGIAGEAVAAVVRWAATHRPGLPVIARVRPANIASQRVALRAGLIRAEHLDAEGYDGLEWAYTTIASAVSGTRATRTSSGR